ncbi:hypothetical protein [Micromonospora zhanjiangensis]|uniref:Uncharacterized protein n=1 Tax=Micromonospora zhanjiangensis TaxID=1522057 RepID=A0ABV8KF25_9ACTN
MGGPTATAFVVGPPGPAAAASLGEYGHRTLSWVGAGGPFHAVFPPRPGDELSSLPREERSTANITIEAIEDKMNGFLLSNFCLP